MVKHFSEILSALFIVILIYAGSLVISDLIDIKIDKPKESEFVVSAETPANQDRETYIDIVSPDEKYNLNLKNVKNDDGTIDQTFTIVKNKDNKKIEVFKVTSSAEKELVIPFNTFSPTDKYFYLEGKDETDRDYLVFNSDGKEFQDGSKYIEVRKLFGDKQPEFKITEITGWAGYTLLLVNSNMSDDKTGPSWWFDMSGKTFIRLSTRFN